MTDLIYNSSMSIYKKLIRFEEFNSFESKIDITNISKGNFENGMDGLSCEDECQHDIDCKKCNGHAMCLNCESYGVYGPHNLRCSNWLLMCKEEKPSKTKDKLWNKIHFEIYDYNKQQQIILQKINDEITDYDKNLKLNIKSIYDFKEDIISRSFNDLQIIKKFFEKNKDILTDECMVFYNYLNRIKKLKI